MEKTKAQRLTYKQQQVLQKVSAEWMDLPSGIGCTNSTLEALERRNLVETRIEPGKETTSFYDGWQWRLKPSA